MSIFGPLEALRGRPIGDLRATDTPPSSKNGKSKADVPPPEPPRRLFVVHLDSVQELPAIKRLSSFFPGNPILVWKGGVNWNWDKSTANWLGGNGIWADGDNAVFDATGIGRQNVNVVAGGVNPNTLLFNNANFPGSLTNVLSSSTMTGSSRCIKSLQ